MVQDSDTKLTGALTDIRRDTIDTFSDFPTKEAIDLQVSNRTLGKTLGLKYFDNQADFVSEIMRSFMRKGRSEVVLSRYQSLDMYKAMVGEGSDQYLEGKTANIQQQQ